MPIGPELPTAKKLSAIADDFGLDLDAGQLDTFQALVAGTVEACRAVDAMIEPKLPVKYPRDAGWQPDPQDNPFNGWAWRCEIKGADDGLLSGQRIAIKDVVPVAGLPMTLGSRLLDGYTADVDATIVTRMLDAGGTILGKTNCEDMCFSGGGHTCSLGPVLNPFDETRNPGASSNGSAVVLATGQADIAIGGDQGGSIRIPAAWSGVYGLKPTYGLVPYTGCAMIEATLDHIGPMANSTEGVARLLSAIAGTDPLDPRQRGVIPSDHNLDYLASLDRGVEGVRIGLVKDGFGFDGSDGQPPSDKAVDARVRDAVHALEERGAIVEEVSLPAHAQGAVLWSVIATLGATEFMLKGNGQGTNWSGWYNTSLGEAVARGLRSRPDDMADTVKLTLLSGEYMQREYFGRHYWKAQNLRAQVTAAYDDALRKYDLLAMPTVPFTATEMVGRDASIEDSISSALNMVRNTCVADVTGHPSMSIPCGMENGLPVGLMLTGSHLGDAQVLQAAQAFESLGDWKTR